MLSADTMEWCKILNKSKKDRKGVENQKKKKKEQEQEQWIENKKKWWILIQPSVITLNVSGLKTSKDR